MLLENNAALLGIEGNIQKFKSRNIYLLYFKLFVKQYFRSNAVFDFSVFEVQTF